MAQTRDNSNGQFVKGNAPTAGPTNGQLSEIQRTELAYNVMLSRSQMIAQLLDPRRDINDDCGYPETNEISGSDYRQLYDREAVATRVAEVLPKESWQLLPVVFETEDVAEETEFEAAWREVAQSLKGGNWFRDEQVSPIWEYLIRADILSGIGSFGVLLLGIDDGKGLDEPADGLTETGLSSPRNDGRKLLYLRAFDESLVSVNRYVSDISNPRYGLPAEYSVTFNDPRDETDKGGSGMPLATQSIHWSRCVHLADNLGSSEVFGVPRMRPVYNRLLDLRKLYGGSAEMYWRGAFPGLSVETHPQLGGDVEIDKSALRTQIEQYQNTLQRYLALTGMSAKSLAPQVVDPTNQIDVQLTAICIRLGIPKRIFMGSERGELSSNQDASTWTDRLRDRQTNYINPRVIAPFVNRLIALGVLPVPERYGIVWPDLESVSDAEQAVNAAKRMEAITKYVQGDVESLMHPADFLTREMGFSAEDADAILEGAASIETDEDVGEEFEQTPTSETE